MKLIKLVINYLLGVVGILLISCIPVLFQNNFNFKIGEYFQSLWTVIQTIVNPSEWHIQQVIGYRLVDQPLLSFVADNYVYSMTILFTALTIALICGFVFALLTYQLPKRIKGVVIRFLNSLEALPDVLFIFLLQLLVVWYFKTFDVLLFKFVTLGDEKVYLSPILSLSIVPTILFFKVILLLLDEEWSKDYIQLAKSKGFGKLSILFRHCLRNIKNKLFIQSKPIVWATLSTLLVVEYLHNFYGIVRLVFFDPRPFVIAASLIMIFTPFYLLFNLFEWIFKIDTEKHFDDNAKLYRRLKLFSGINGLSISTLFKGIITSIGNFFKGFITLCKKPKFSLAIIYVLGLVLVSFIYSAIVEEPVERIGIYQDESGEYHSPAHPPGDRAIFGTDAFGHPVLSMLIVGAKYTILISALIAFLRIFLGYLLTIPYMFWLGEKTKKVINKLAEGMQFLPLTLIAYVLLVGVVIFPELDKAVGEKVVIPNTILEIVILTIFVVPVMLNALGSESNAILKSEHIQAAMVLGASKSRIFFKHITKQLFPRMVFLFGQQMIQVLQVLIHLSIFSIFLGGGIRGDGDNAGHSYLFDWTSMFENMRIIIASKQYWLIIPLLIVYALLIFSIQAIINSIIEEQQRKIGVYSKLPRRRKFRIRKSTRQEASKEIIRKAG